MKSPLACENKLLLLANRKENNSYKGLTWVPDPKSKEKKCSFTFLFHITAETAGVYIIPSLKTWQLAHQSQKFRPKSQVAYMNIDNQVVVK